MMRSLNNPVLAILLAFTVTLVLFYFLDHGIMSIQGLPLNTDLSPAQ